MRLSPHAALARWAVWGTALVLGACTSERSTTVLGWPDGGAAVETPKPAGPLPPATPHTARRLRRLTNAEVETVIADLVGTRLDVTKGFLPDPRVDGYDTDVVALGISDSKVDELATAAERVAAYVTAPANLARFAPCPTGVAAEACAVAFAQRFATGAWGRAPEAAELTRLLAVFQAGRDGADDAAGLALVIEAILQSPHFLYRTELGNGGGTMTGPEIASALSFLLRGSRPDAELLAAADRLAAPAERAAQARRLLAMPGARAHLRGFLRAWLGLEGVAVINKDFGTFPVFNPSVRRALDREVETFLTFVLDEGSGRVDELMTADYSFPSPTLLPLYGADLLDAPGDFTRVRLGEHRRGLLSSPAWLSAHALVNQSNPIDRGLLVRTRLFCQDVAPPPPGVANQPPGGGKELTTRQKYEQHEREPRCRGCHELMDPLGFGFENFDAIGRYRLTENDQPVDGTGNVSETDVDGPFTGPAELGARLVQSELFRECFVRQLWRYAEGRVPVPPDEGDILHLAADFAAADRHIEDLLVALVSRDNFIRRVPAEEKP